MIKKYGRYYADWTDSAGTRKRKSFATKKAAARFQTARRNESKSKKAPASAPSAPSAKRGPRRTSSITYQRTAQLPWRSPLSRGLSRPTKSPLFISNPWTVVARSAVYENEWIRVDHHEVLGPAGGPGVYGTVHFKNQATGVVPIDEQGNVILVGQYRFPLGAYSWEIPEGGGPHSVSALESAQRELREECGLAANSWMEIVKMDLSNSVSDEHGTVFLAWQLSEVPAQPDATEELQVARVPFWEAVDRAKRGEIRDSMSVAALIRVALMALQGELPEPIARAIGLPVAG